MGHISPNYAFLLFWNFFVLIHSKFVLLFKKVTISERSTEIHRKFVFVKQVWKGANQEENLDLFNQLFFIKPI